MNMKLLSLALVAICASAASQAADNVNVQLNGSFSPSPCTVTPSALDIALPNLKYDVLPAVQTANIYGSFTPAQSLTIKYKCAAATNAGIRYLSDLTGVPANPLTNNVGAAGNNSAFFALRDSSDTVLGQLQLETTTQQNWAFADNPNIPTALIFNYKSAFATRTSPQVVKSVISTTEITQNIVMRYALAKPKFDASKETALTASVEVQLYY